MLVRENLMRPLCPARALACGALAIGLLFPATAMAQGERPDPLAYPNLIRITPRDGATGDLAPIVRIVCPLRIREWHQARET